MGDASPSPDDASPPTDANYGAERLSNRSVWSLFEPESAAAPSVAPSTPKRCCLRDIEIIPAFPPCHEDDYDMLNHGNAPTFNENDPSNAPTATATSSTTLSPNTPLVSTYDYIARRDVFPFSIPDEAKQIILSTIIAISSIRSPRPFQVFAIYCMVFLCSQVIYIIRKTGEGKSLVIITTAALLRGVTIVMVPLIGLGSDQVNKAVNLGQRIEAYHVDKNVGNIFLCLKKRLLSIEM